MSWADGPFAMADTETTGVDPLNDRLVTATLALYRAGRNVDVRTWLADPGVEIPDAAAEIHKITTEHAREHGRPIAEVLTEVAKALGTAWASGLPVLGYQVSYDLTLLAAECRRHGVEMPEPGPVIDGRVLDQHVDRWRKGSRKLVDVCRHYRVTLTEAHTATADALAAGRVVWRIAQQHPHLAALTLAELHELQAKSYAESQRSFAGYLRGPKVLGKEPDEAKRADITARADDIEAYADQWPIRIGATA